MARTKNKNQEYLKNPVQKSEILKALIYVFIGVMLTLAAFTFSNLGDSKKQDKNSNDTGPATTSTTNASSSINWVDSEIPEQIRDAVGKNFMEIKTEQSGEFAVYKKADITGDGIEEAVVSLGSGGAYTSYYALMQSIDGTPRLARFKHKNGDIGNVMFLEGASVSHGISFELVPSKQAIYSESWALDPMNTDTIECEIEAYQWNETTSLFEYSQALGDSATGLYCSKINIES